MATRSRVSLLWITIEILGNPCFSPIDIFMGTSWLTISTYVGYIDNLPTKYKENKKPFGDSVLWRHCGKLANQHFKNDPPPFRWILLHNQIMYVYIMSLLMITYIPQIKNNIYEVNKVRITQNGKGCYLKVRQPWHQNLLKRIIRRPLLTNIFQQNLSYQWHFPP